jgi:hypothetical protein
VILVLQRPLIIFTSENQFKWLLRSAFATVVCRRVMEFFLYIPAGYHTGQRYARYQIWMAPYLTMALIRAFVLPRWLGGACNKFKPTGSLGSALEERDPGKRKGLGRRLWGILVECQAVFHLGFVYFVLVAVCVVSYRCFVVERGWADVLRALITRAWWPPVTWVFLASSMWTPVAYAVCPPSVPEREELLERDVKTGIAHPREVAKKIGFGGWAFFYELEYTLTTLFSGLCFVASFLYF